MRYYLDKFNRPREYPSGRSVAHTSLRATDVRVVSPRDAAKGLGTAGEPVLYPDPPRVVRSMSSTSHGTSHADVPPQAPRPVVEVDLRGSLDVADDLPTYHAPGPSPSPASEPSPSVVHSSTGAEPSPVSDRADVYPDVESTPSTAAGPELDAFDLDVPMPSTSSKRVVGDDELALVTAFGEPLAVRLCSPSGTLIPFTSSESERFREAVRMVLEKRTPAWLDEYGDLAMLGLCLYGAAAVRGRAPAPPAMVEALGGRLVVVDLDGERVAMPVDEAKRRGLVQPTSAPVVERRAADVEAPPPEVTREAAGQ